MNRSHRIPLFLCAALVAGAAGALRAQDQQADPKARELMREVYGKRYTWDERFPGFEGRLTVTHKGQEHLGSFRVEQDYSVQVNLTNEPARKWAADALASIAGHRRGTSFDEADGRYPLTLGPQDTHPAGRLVRLNDMMNSTYRVRDGQIMQVNRSAGPKMRFTIDMLENITVEEDRYLPRVFTVAFFESGSGELVRTDTFWDSYRKIGTYHLPESRRQVRAEDAATEIAILQLEEVKLLR